MFEHDPCRRQVEMSQTGRFHDFGTKTGTLGAVVSCVPSSKTLKTNFESALVD